MKLYVVCTLNRLDEAILMSTPTYNYCTENRKQSLNYRSLLPDLAPWLTLSGSNCPCLEQFSMVPKMFGPLWPTVLQFVVRSKRPSGRVVSASDWITRSRIWIPRAAEFSSWLQYFIAQSLSLSPRLAPRPWCHVLSLLTISWFKFMYDILYSRSLIVGLWHLQD